MVFNVNYQFRIQSYSIAADGKKWCKKNTNCPMQMETECTQNVPVFGYVRISHYSHIGAERKKLFTIFIDGIQNLQKLIIHTAPHSAQAHT